METISLGQFRKIIKGNIDTLKDGGCFKVEVEESMNFYWFVPRHGALEDTVESTCTLNDNA